MGGVEISAIWTALNAAVKTATSAFKTVEDVKAKEAIADIQSSLIDVQTKLLTIQSQYEALTEVKRQLEQQIVQYEKWDAEATRYKLQKIAEGIFVYVLQSDQAKGDPIHWLCPNCFDQRQKSVLQRPGVDYLNYKCHRCSFDVVPKSQYSSGSGHVTGYIDPDYSGF